MTKPVLVSSLLFAGLVLASLVPSHPAIAPTASVTTATEPQESEDQSVNLSMPSESGGLKAAWPMITWGGTKGSALRAGKTTKAKLSLPKDQTSTASAWLIQVNITKAKQAGTLKLGSGQAQIAFPKGASSA
ncbi:MAG: hypothetical protein LBG70_05135, partial [Bifidobacteriaceae bacterium]|nr:hypothetical protein [Bifidobacteriaceae bacterium]